MTQRASASSSKWIRLAGAFVIACAARTGAVPLPSVPVLSVPENGIPGQHILEQLSWTADPLAGAYEVQAAIVSNFSATTFDQTGCASSVMLNNLSPSTTYYWRVQAFDSAGASGWSNAWNFTTVHFVFDTATGSTMSIELLTSTNPTLNGAPLGAYDEIGAFSKAGLCVGGAVWDSIHNKNIDVVGQDFYSSTTDGLQGGDTIYFRVWNYAAQAEVPAVATLPGGGRPLYSGGGIENLSGFTALSVPTLPALSSPANGSANQPVTVSLSWNSAGYAALYQVQVATAAGFGSTVYSRTGLSGSTVSVSGLANQATYYWRAEATNCSGTCGWSGTWSFVTVVAPPDIPSLTAPCSGALVSPLGLSLAWNSSARAASYSVQLSTSADFCGPASVYNGIGPTTLTLPALCQNATCYWRVGAVNAGGSSAWSGSWTFATLFSDTVPVEAGWNMISLNIRPSDSNASAVFGDSASVAGRQNFILVKTLSGRVYMPTMGISDSIVLQTGVGYQMYSYAPDTVRTAGSAIPAFATPITLLQGWNLLGYLPQTDLPIAAALSGIAAQIMMVKDNDGDIYWPSFGVEEMDSLVVGQGYFVYLTDSATLTYADSGVAKLAARAGGMLRLPKSRHYPKHANTGDNASVLVTRVSFGSGAAPDSCEIGAWDESGRLVGSGAVIHGIAAFPVWGTNRLTGQKDGLGNAEKIAFTLWINGKQYPAVFKTSGGADARYLPQGIIMGTVAVPEGAAIGAFDLAGAYPNPFKGSVRIAFDVPPINGQSQQAVEIDVYDLKGSLVKQLAKGLYAAGHYETVWNCGEGRDAAMGSNVYIVAMKAANFDKRLKLVKIQ